MDDEDQPTQKPGLFEVDEEAATRALERSLIQLDALLLAPAHVETGIGINFSTDQQSEPILLQSIDESTLLIGTSKFRSESLSMQFSMQIGLPGDSQLDLSIPFHSNRLTRSTSASGVLTSNLDDTSSGSGDFRIGFLKTITKERGYRPDLIALVAFDADTADNTNPAIGSGAEETTLGLNATKRQDPLAFTFGLSHTVANSDDEFQAGPVTQFSAGTVLAASPYTSLHIGFTQFHSGEFEIGGENIDGSSTIGATLQIGASSVLSKTIFMSGSVAAGLTDTGPDYSFSVILSKRFEIME